MGPMQLQIRRKSSGAEHTLDIREVDELTVGRDSSNDVQLPFSFVSSRHLHLRRVEKTWSITDLGSTNGTEVDGIKLQPHRSFGLQIGALVTIQDIELSLAESIPTSFTIAHSGTLVRQLLKDGLATDEIDSAFFEVIEGPNTGERVYIPDHLDAVPLRISNTKLELLEEAENSNSTLIRVSDGFGIESELELLTNGAPYQSGKRILNGSRLSFGPLTFVFFDPLEELLPAPAPTEATLTPATQDEHREEAPQEDGEEEQALDQEQEKEKAPGGAEKWIVLIALACLLLTIGLVAMFFF